MRKLKKCTCGKSIEGKQAGAVHCSGRCRARVSREKTEESRAHRVMMSKAVGLLVNLDVDQFREVLRRALAMRNPGAAGRLHVRWRAEE